jgi:hypothetical protein
MSRMIKQAMLDGLGYGIALESLGMMAGVNKREVQDKR